MAVTHSKTPRAKSSDRQDLDLDSWIPEESKPVEGVTVRDISAACGKPIAWVHRNVISKRMADGTAERVGMRGNAHVYRLKEN